MLEVFGKSLIAGPQSQKLLPVEFGGKPVLRELALARLKFVPNHDLLGGEGESGRIADAKALPKNLERCKLLFKRNALAPFAAVQPLLFARGGGGQLANRLVTSKGRLERKFSFGAQH